MTLKKKRSADVTALDDAAKRVQAWMVPDEWASAAPDFDHAAYDRMADTLIGAMAAVGRTDSMMGVGALTKALALVMAAVLNPHPDEVVAEWCHGLQTSLHLEILKLRQAEPFFRSPEK